jgi:hypothetical protein
MTVEELNELVNQGAKVFFIDPRTINEFFKLNIGGNRMMINEIESKTDVLKTIHTEGYQFVVGCTFHDSSRIPQVASTLAQMGINVSRLHGSRERDGGIVHYANTFGRQKNVPPVNLADFI